MPARSLSAGSGFTPGETIDIIVAVKDPGSGEVTGSRPASTTTADGAFSVLLALKRPVVQHEQVGNIYSLLATGQTSGITFNQIVGLFSGGPVSGLDDLANTRIEANAMMLSLIGAGALGAGVGLVAVSRRRTHAEQVVW